MLLGWKLLGNTLKAFIRSVLFSFQELFSFWRKPNLGMRLSVFQRGVSSRGVCLPQSSPGTRCSQEGGVCIWARDAKERITNMLLRTISVTGLEVQIIVKQIILENSCVGPFVWRATTFRVCQIWESLFWCKD